MSMDGKVIQKQIDHWQAEQEKWAGAVRTAQHREAQASEFLRGWKAALASLDATEFDSESGGAARATMLEVIEDARRDVIAETPLWRLIIGVLVLRGRTAKIQDIRKDLEQCGKLTSKPNVAYSQVHSNASRKPAVFRVGGGEVTLLLSGTEAESEVGSPAMVALRRILQ